MSRTKKVDIDAGGLHYRELNEKVRRAAEDGAREILLRNVRGQRYIGAGLASGLNITIEGVPGNDLACFMAGAGVVVRGNAQDGVANTMSAGRVAVHGHAGDVLGYSMRGGKVYVLGDAGYRVGIHMKAFRESVPVLVIGGKARDYLGEYMAGGILVVLGLGAGKNESLAGDFLGTGMHGGDIFLRGPVDGCRLGKEVGQAEVDDAAWLDLQGHLCDFSREYGLDPGQFVKGDFTRLRPVSHRPYGKIYIY